MKVAVYRALSLACGSMLALGGFTVAANASPQAAVGTIKSCTYAALPAGCIGAVLVLFLPGKEPPRCPPGVAIATSLPS